MPCAERTENDLEAPLLLHDGNLYFESLDVSGTKLLLTAISDTSQGPEKLFSVPTGMKRINSIALQNDDALWVSFRSQQHDESWEGEATLHLYNSTTGASLSSASVKDGAVVPGTRVQTWGTDGLLIFRDDSGKTYSVE